MDPLKDIDAATKLLDAIQALQNTLIDVWVANASGRHYNGAIARIEGQLYGELGRTKATLLHLRDMMGDG